VRQLINLKDYNFLEVNKKRKKDELTPELQAYQQHHLSHFLKYQPSDVKKIKELISSPPGNNHHNEVV
jgi:hypothetical protein